MSYFNEPSNHDGFEDDYVEEAPSQKSRMQLNLGIFLLIFGLVGTTVAANISLGGVNRKKEFGQGTYQIKACDQWVGIGLTTGQGAQNTYVANVRLIGLDPRLCKGTIFRIKFFATGSTTALPMYLGAGTTTAATDSVTATTLVTRITNTAYTGGSSAAYEAWAYDALTLIDPQGRDIQFGDRYEVIDYTPATAVYTVIFTLPKAVATQVARITIETAKY